MRFHLNAALVATLCLAGTTVPAAAGAGEDLLRQVVSGAGTSLCFARRYDAAHLSARPDQRTSEIRLRLAPSWAPGAPACGEFLCGSLAVRTRGASRHQWHVAHVACGTDDRGLVCAWAKDAGGFTLDRRPNGDLRLSELSSEIAWQAPPGHSGPPYAFSEADGTFVMPAAPAARCAEALTGAHR